MVPVVVVYITE